MADQYQGLIRTRLQESLSVHEAAFGMVPEIAKVADVLVEAYRCGNQAHFCGNGGSAADAQHLAAELVGKYLMDRPALPAQALTVNTSNLTAIGNDYSYDLVFARQLRGLGRRGDVVVGISTSGNSRNVVEAFAAAKEMGITTVALTGAGGGKMKEVADYCLCIPSRETPRIQEGHILVGHILCELIETSLFGEGQGEA